MKVKKSITKSKKPKKDQPVRVSVMITEGLLMKAKANGNVSKFVRLAMDSYDHQNHK